MIVPIISAEILMACLRQGLVQGASGKDRPEVGAALRFLLDAVAGGAENEKGALLALLDAREGRRGAPRG